jgi:hypothetical protein
MVHSFSYLSLQCTQVDFGWIFSTLFLLCFMGYFSGNYDEKIFFFRSAAYYYCFSKRFQLQFQRKMDDNEKTSYRFHGAVKSEPQRGSNTVLQSRGPGFVGKR